MLDNRRLISACKVEKDEISESMDRYQMNESVSVCIDVEYRMWHSKHR